MGFPGQVTVKVVEVAEAPAGLGKRFGEFLWRSADRTDIAERWNVGRLDPVFAVTQARVPERWTQRAG